MYSPSSTPSFRFLAVFLVIGVASCCAAAQGVSGSTKSGALITKPIDPSQTTVLKGNTHPSARAKFDRGVAPDSLQMERMLVVLKRSAEQESALRELMDEQQDKASPSYHKWLTPEDFGRRFGPADSDIQAVSGWLQSRGFRVTSLSKGKTVIEFSGTAGQVRDAFRTTIHKYVVDGESHWANASDPSIPSALTPVVKGIVSLHNFPRRPHSTVQGVPVRATKRQMAPLPLYTFATQDATYYGLGPSDFATIYNVLPLWNAGIDGTGQTIAIVGESNINLTDIEAFRSLFGLPKNDPQVIVNGPDPGLVGDEPEAVLDVSWSGAVAKNATIKLVVSAMTESTLGVDLSALYIVDNNLAPVMSESYGECEAVLGNAGNAFYNALWQQAAAQGITVLVSSGDAGSAGCDNFNTEAGAVYGTAMSGFATTPYNVAVGGTDFDQTATTAPNYWNATNNATTGASAKGYIPETTWNDSCAGLGIDQCTYSTDLFNIVAGSGGPSSCSTQDSSGNCLSGYSKPSWQVGNGVPADGARDTPDVSLFASNGFNNSFYIICEADALFFSEPCSLTNLTFLGIGGTSASAPAFAGIMALVNQKMASQGLSARQGNPNYTLYKLAGQSGASCDSSTAPGSGNACIFYDVTKGNDSVPCNPNTPNCGPAPAAGGLGVLVDPNNTSNPAWLTTPGYDLATGLGSVNANNLVNAWGGVTFNPSVTTLTNLSPASVTHGQPVSISVKVAPQSGSGTPTGTVSLQATPGGKNLGIDVFPLNNGVASGTTTLLPGGTYNVTAHYAGDANFGASDSSPDQITVSKENSQTKATLVAYDMTAGNFYQTNTIPYGSIFFVRGDVTGAAGVSCIPNPQQTQAACPSGTVNFTSNGKALDAGTYALNSEGYVEDQVSTPDFATLGSYAVGAQYSGDSSFNSSNATMNATVTQGTTSVYLYVSGLAYPPTVYSGESFQMGATAYANSVLAAPTGTVSILENGSAPSGTMTVIPRDGAFYPDGGYYLAYLATNWTTSIDTPGIYTLTASYSGDVNYMGSQGTYTIPVTVLDTTFNITPPIPDMTVTAGQSGTTNVTLTGVDNFLGTVNVTCQLPAEMKEATCPAVSASLFNVTSATAQLTVTTTAPHTVASGRVGLELQSIGIVAGIFLIGIPAMRRRKPIAMLMIVSSVALIVSCGGQGRQVQQTQDPGTPKGVYTVNVTAVSNDITRTASFTVTVQ